MARYRFSGTDLGSTANYALLDSSGNVVLDMDGHPIHPDNVPGASDDIEGGGSGMEGDVEFHSFKAAFGTLVSGSLTAEFVSNLTAVGVIVTATETERSGASDGGTLTAETMHGASARSDATVQAQTIDNLDMAGHPTNIVVQTGSILTADDVINRYGDAGSESSLISVGAGGTITVQKVFSTAAANMYNEVVGGTLTVGEFAIDSTSSGISDLSIRTDTATSTGGKVVVNSKIGLGLHAGDISRLTIQGVGSTLIYKGAQPLVGGDLGQAQIDISQGAAVKWSSLTLGKQATGNGGLSLHDASSMHILNNLIIGDGGRGYVQVYNQSTIQVDGNLITANQADAQPNSLHVDGGKLTINGDMLLGNVGNDGIGNNLGASFGGEITVKSALRMAVGAGTSTTLFVSGDNSKLTLAGTTAVVGQGGFGHLSVNAGGKLVGNTVNMVLGDKPTGEGWLDITAVFFGEVRAAATATVNSLLVGTRGKATLQMGENGTLTVLNDLAVGGPNATVYDWGGTIKAKGSVVIGSTGATPANVSVMPGHNPTGGPYDGNFFYGDMSVGRIGTGSLSVFADVADAQAIVAPLAGGTGSLELGRLGRGTMSIDGDGAEVDAVTMTLGGRIARPGVADNGDCGIWKYSGGTGTANVADQGYLSVANTLLLQGVSQEVTLTIRAGGGVEIGGHSAPRADTLLVDDGGTLVGHGIINVGPVVDFDYTGKIINNGTIEAKDGILSLQGVFTGSGKYQIDDKAFLEIVGDFRGNIDFNGGHDTVLQIDRPDPTRFKGVIGNLAEGDTIRLRDPEVPGLIAHTEIKGAVLNITFDTGQVWHYKLDADYTGDTFTIQNGRAFTDLTFQHESQQIRTNVDGTPTGNPFIDSLVWGHAAWKAGAGPITYWFGQNADVDDAVHAHGDNQYLNCRKAVDTWSSAETATFRQVLDVYSSVTGLTFQEAASATDANLCLWQTNRLGDDVAGSSDLPAKTTDGHLWMFFNNTGSFGAGGFTRYAYGHELGHALGLAHPHDGGDEPDATLFPGVTSSADPGTDGQNQSIFTIMSYVRGFDSSPPTEYGNQAGLGAFDIAALQVLYGANEQTADGNDTYDLPRRNTAGTGWSCIWDTGGKDTISNEGSFKACIIDLNDAPLVGPDAGGFVSRVLGVEGGFTIAKGAQIENATGGGGDDILIGNEKSNHLEGGQGVDAFIFDAALNGNTNVDYIVDLSHADDSIELDKAIFHALGSLVTNTEFRKAGSVASAHALDGNDYLIYNQTNGALFYDPDGNGLLKQVQFAVMNGSPDTLAFDDFFMI